VKAGVVRGLVGVALLILLAGGGYGWQQQGQLTQVRAQLATQDDERARLAEDLERATLEAAQANRRADAMRETMQASADAAAAAREAADQALAQVVQAEQAAQEAAVAEAEQAREAAERQAAAAAEAQQRADAAVEGAPSVDSDCPAGPGEEAAACWAQREGLTLTCPETDHWVRSLDECTPEALFGPDWEEFVDQ
jgi:seryl-tRNA synthetase